MPKCLTKVTRINFKQPVLFNVGEFVNNITPMIICGGFIQLGFSIKTKEIGNVSIVSLYFSCGEEKELMEDAHKLPSILKTKLDIAEKQCDLRTGDTIKLFFFRKNQTREKIIGFATNMDELTFRILMAGCTLKTIEPFQKALSQTDYWFSFDIGGMQLMQQAYLAKKSHPAQLIQMFVEYSFDVIYNKTRFHEKDLSYQDPEQRLWSKIDPLSETALAIVEKQIVRQLSELKILPQKEELVLYVGSGEGRNLKAIAEATQAKCYAVEPYQQLAEKSLANKNVSPDRLFVMNAEEFPNSLTGHFSLILICNYNVLSNHKMFFLTLKRLLRPEGCLVVGIMRGESLFKGSSKSLDELIKDTFGCVAMIKGRGDYRQHLFISKNKLEKEQKSQANLSLETRQKNQDEFDNILYHAECVDKINRPLNSYSYFAAYQNTRALVQLIKEIPPSELTVWHYFSLLECSYDLLEHRLIYENYERLEKAYKGDEVLFNEIFLKIQSYLKKTDIVTSENNVDQLIVLKIKTKQRLKDLEREFPDDPRSLIKFSKEILQKIILLCDQRLCFSSLIPGSFFSPANPSPGENQRTLLAKESHNQTKHSA